MGRFLLFEDEQLVVRFRPHTLAYLGRYAGSLAWLVPGAAGALLAALLAAGRPASWGLVAFVVLAILWGFTMSRLRGQSMAFTWFVVFAGLGLIVADIFHSLPFGEYGWAAPLGLGVLAIFCRTLWWELDRLGRVHFLTTERLVIRGGIGNRREHTRYVKEIQELRSVRGLFGQMFDYGDLTLVLGRQVRGGKDPRVVEDKQVLAGVGRLEEVKHHLEELIQEQRLPAKDRKRRIEERRVRESMRRLAHWMRRESSARQRT